MPDTATVHVWRPLSPFCMFDKTLANLIKQTSVIVVYVWKHQLLRSVHHHGAIFDTFYSSALAKPHRRQGSFFFFFFFLEAMKGK